MNLERGGDIKTTHQPALRLMAWDAVRMVWTVRATVDVTDTPTMARVMLDLKRQKLRIRVIPCSRTIITEDEQPPYNVTESHRHLQAAIMSDLADAKKRYKSPG